MQKTASRADVCRKDHGAMEGTDQQRLMTGDPALSRIAHVFGMTPEAFVQAAVSGENVPASFTSAVQARALLNDFLRITDPSARERCLDYVREAAVRDAGHAA